MTIKKIKSLIFLGYHFFIHFIKKPFAKKNGKHQFLKNYKDDGIFEVPKNIRELMPNFSSCLTCQICDFYCPNAQNSSFSPSQMVQSFSRSLPDFKNFKNYDFCSSDCKCEKHCPENVKISEIAKFVQTTANKMTSI